MPSQVLTKRRVKRRQQRQRIVSKNAKRNVRSVRKHRKTAKKVMRGGGAIDCTAYVLYDKIPTPSTLTKKLNQGERWLGNMPEDVYTTVSILSKNVPICVVFIVGKGNTGKDDVYLFFNNRMSVVEITTTVKLLLGMSNGDNFELTPILPSPAPRTKNNKLSALWNVGGNMFVKISGCGILNREYCVFSGTLDSPDTLDKVKTTEHKITTNNRKYNEMNGQKLKTSLEDESANGFKNRVLNSKAVLPELYKDYFVAANPVSSDDVSKKASEEAAKLFGKDIEWADANVKEEGKEPPIQTWSDTYDKFKELSVNDIAETILDKEKHQMYGLAAATSEELTNNRPLKITTPMSLSFSNLNATSIFEEINRKSTTIVGDKFTGDDENWWVSKEAANLKEKVDEVEQSKKERVNWCAYDSHSPDCKGYID